LTGVCMEVPLRIGGAGMGMPRPGGAASPGGGPLEQCQDWHPSQLLKESFGCALWSTWQHELIQLGLWTGRSPWAGHGDLVEFHKAHGSILLVSETESLVPALFGEKGHTRTKAIVSHTTPSTHHATASPLRTRMT
jgi:hypothetical protein